MVGFNLHFFGFKRDGVPFMFIPTHSSFSINLLGICS